MKIKTIANLIFLISTLTVFSQEHELGKVTIDELKETTHPKDTSAVAAFLFSKGKTYLEFTQEKGFSIVTEVENKIKVYKKEGYNWANEEVSLYIGGDQKEIVSFSKAITYNLKDGKIEKTKLGSEGEFKEKVNKYWSKEKISMPNVKEGSIIEYKYVIKSPYLTNFPTWEFQKTIPVNYSEYTTKIPEYFIYSTSMKGELAPKILTEEKNQSIVFRLSQREGGTGLNNPQVNTTFSNETINYKEKSTSYILNDIIALKDESFVNNIKNYTSSILHELSMTQYPNSTTKSYASDWESVVKTIYDNEDFGGELNKSNFYEKELDVVLKDAITQENKIAIIFNYVKSSLNWNGFVGYYTDKGVKKAYQDKIGNTADINLLLVSMLRYAKINANPILVSTRSNGIPIFPSRTGFNYVIAGVELENKSIILLDATNKNTSPNIIPEKAMNWFGRMIRKDGSSSLIDLYPKTNSQENISMLSEIAEDGSVKGKQRKELTNYYALQFRDENGNLNQENYIEDLEKDKNFSLVEDYKIDNVNDPSKSIIETYSFTSNNLIDIIGSKMYFSPMLFHQLKANPFKAESRLYPIDFNFPIKDFYRFSIKIPEGYIVESMPQSLNLVMEENMGSFKYSVLENGGVLQFVYNLEINTPIIQSEFYPHLKEFFNQIVLKQNEKIVLAKKI